MPAGGTWTVQNKKRPGAYINFVSVPAPIGVLGDRGVMTCCLPMTWGKSGELIELTGAELLNGKSTSKIGCNAFDTEESLPYRLALAKCYKALIYRADTGGTKASKTLNADLTAAAKYVGSTGNSISIVIVKDKPAEGKYTVNVLFKGVQKESFVVTAIKDFENIESEWVDFELVDEPTLEIPVTAGQTLENGTNGTVSNESYAAFFKAVEGRQWNCLAINSTDASVQPLIVEFIKLLKYTRGRKVQGIVYDYTVADEDAIISVDQGYITDVDTVTTELFPLYAASVTAGANVNESNTAAVVEGAVTIINPVVEEDIADALAAGRFLLTYRQDGAVCIEQDINTLHTFTVDKGYAFSKNRVVRCLDEIGNTAALIFNRNYCGKIDNDDNGRNLYKTELISMMDNLVTLGAIQNFDGASDITVLPGESIDSVVVDITVQPVDSMEKLYMTVNVNA